jgi:hypothetical protein
MRTRFTTLAFAALAASACLAPGTEILPAPGDFAFLEIKLQG